MIYTSIDGVRREIGKARVDVAGRNRLVYDGHCGVSGVSRQFLWGYIQPEWCDGVYIVPNQVVIREYDMTLNQYGSIVMTEDFSSADWLETVNERIRPYGAVSVNQNTGMLSAQSYRNGGADTYAVILNSRMVLDLYAVNPKTNDRFNLPTYIPAKALKDLKFTGLWSVSTGSSGNGLTGSFFMNTVVGPFGYYTGSASGRNTVAPTNSDIGYCYDIQLVSVPGNYGTWFMNLTPEQVTFGGASFKPKIVFENEKEWL